MFSVKVWSRKTVPADIVSFIYRPEYYGIDEWDDDDRSSSEGQAEFIVAKHRNGGLDTIRLKFTPQLGKFENLSDVNYPFEYPSKINEIKKRRDPTQGDLEDKNNITPF